jgi:hypothetical protein
MWVLAQATRLLTAREHDGLVVEDRHALCCTGGACSQGRGGGKVWIWEGCRALLTSSNPLPLSPKDVSPMGVEIVEMPVVEATNSGGRDDPKSLDT